MLITLNSKAWAQSETIISTLTVLGADSVGYSVKLASGITMPDGTVNAGLFIGHGGGITNVVHVDGGTMNGQLTLAGSTLTITGPKFSVGGSTLVVTDGNVGIGASPFYPLEVNRTSRGFGHIGMKLKSESAEGTGILFTDGGNYSMGWGTDSGGSLRAALNWTDSSLGVQRMMIGSGGGVQIGTSGPPQDGLDVELNANIGTYVGYYTAPYYGLIVSGYVGFGTPAPRAMLEVRSSTGPSQYVLQVSSQNSQPTLIVQGDGAVGIGTGTAITLLDVNGSAQFGNGPTKSTFTSTGQLNVAASGIKFADGTVQVSSPSAGASLNGSNIWGSSNTFAGYLQTVGHGVGDSTNGTILNQMEWFWVKSIDGATQSSGCVVALGIGNGNSAVSNSMTATSTTSINAGIWTTAFLDTCVPGTYCRVATKGVMRIQSLVSQVVGHHIRTSSTRCQGASGTLSVQNGGHYAATDSTTWATVVFGLAP